MNTPPSTDNNSTFFEELYDFVKKYNIKFKKIKDFDDTISVYVNIKPSGIFVSYAPLIEEDFPKKQWKKFYGSFKINKVDMLKFLNNYSKKNNFIDEGSGLFRNIKDHPDYSLLNNRLKEFKELKKLLKQMSTTMIKEIDGGKEKITKLIGIL